MHIIHISSEFSPIVRVGGLGDVIHGLAQEQAAMGNFVSVVLPKYDVSKFSAIKDLQIDTLDLWSFDGHTSYHNTIWSTCIGKIKVYLIEMHHPQYYFNRGCVYGSRDDVERFLYFCRTASEFLHIKKIHADIIHIHDWLTSPVAPIMKCIYQNLGFQYGAIALTIHNIKYQGQCSIHNFTRIGLKGEDFRVEDRMQDPVDPNILNLLKGGITYSDIITTVSPTYAKEIMKPEFGFHLHHTLFHLQHKVKGILNGIDTETTWNPEHDAHLSCPFSIAVRSTKTVLEKKRENRVALYKQLNLQNSCAPLIICISRLVPQKNPHLIEKTIHYTMQQNCCFILLGKVPHAYPEIHKTFTKIFQQYKSTGNIYIKLDYDEALSHQLFASASAIFIPSIFEPCGLTAMISAHYGTLPIVHGTGGLQDTVIDADNTSVPEPQRNGFCFSSLDEEEVQKTIQRAICCIKQNPRLRLSLLKSGMQRKIDWQGPAKQYQNVYEQAIASKSPNKKVI